MEVAKTGKGIEEEGGAVFDVTKFQLDYLTTPSGFLDIGIDYNKTDITTRACQTDELYIIAYPHFNVNGKYFTASCYLRCAVAATAAAAAAAATAVARLMLLCCCLFCLAINARLLLHQYCI